MRLITYSWGPWYRSLLPYLRLQKHFGAVGSFIVFTLFPSICTVAGDLCLSARKRRMIKGNGVLDAWMLSFPMATLCCWSVSTLLGPNVYSCNLLYWQFAISLVASNAKQVVGSSLQLRSLLPLLPVPVERIAEWHWKCWWDVES